MESVLQVKNLHKSFRSEFLGKKTDVLRGVNFTVEAGSVTGFLGGNGAGKTTTLKCILGLIGIDKGEISYFGSPHLTLNVKAKIGFLPERPYFYEYLTGEEFLRLYARLSGRMEGSQLNRRVDEILDRVRLLHAKKRALRSYSKGMLQRVGIAQALIHGPEFILLDEPMTGLDPDGRREVTEIIRETAGQGTTVFFSSHLLFDAEAICDHLVIMRQGTVLFTGLQRDFLSEVPQPYVMRFLSRRGGQEELIVESPQKLQAEIDRLRMEKLEIIDIRQKRTTLEEVFIKVALGD
jgi:ABC-2 type transport system ATP-binding protein